MMRRVGSTTAPVGLRKLGTAIQRAVVIVGPRTGSAGQVTVRDLAIREQLTAECCNRRRPSNHSPLSTTRQRTTRAAIATTAPTIPAISAATVSVHDVDLDERVAVLARLSVAAHGRPRLTPRVRRTPRL